MRALRQLNQVQLSLLRVLFILLTQLQKSFYLAVKLRTFVLCAINTNRLSARF